ncbi:unnamed protein product [Urochloa humidicola]
MELLPPLLHAGARARPGSSRSALAQLDAGEEKPRRSTSALAGRRKGGGHHRFLALRGCRRSPPRARTGPLPSPVGVVRRRDRGWEREQHVRRRAESAGRPCLPG